MKTPCLAAIILAGGLSTRMKELKPLLPLGNATVADYVMSIFRSIGVDVLLVVGYRQEEIVSVIKQKDIKIVINPDYAKGMLSSVQAGVRCIQPEHQAFFILPVDIPLVKLSTIEKLKNTWIHQPDNVIYPAFKGKRGHPPLIPATLAPGILSWKKDGGLKTFLELYEELALDVPVNDSFILFDVDTPEDYEELLKRYKKI
jgi:CTP:molybdopterin cytidylyltransferase MocA